jgi:diguanylate cyclase (GGDEF)-like protein/PAS domain S-box-containing protein
VSVTTETVPSQSFYHCMLESLTDGVFFVDLDGTVLCWNHAAQTQTGYRAEEVVGLHYTQDLLTHIEDENAQTPLGDHPVSGALSGGAPREADAFMRHAAGHLVPVHVRVVPVHDAEGELLGVVETFHDCSSRISAEAQLEELRRKAMIDSVTNLPGHGHLEFRLRSRLDETRRYGWEFGIVIAGIDNFSAISEAYETDTCDQLVRMVAKTFTNTLRTFDVVGRWSDDEFLAVVPIKQPVDVGIIGERVRSLVEKGCLATQSMLLGVTVSVGVTAAEEVDTVDSVIERARSGMQRSLKAGGNSVSE